MERQFLLAITFIFPIPVLVPHRAALVIISLITVLHCQPLLFCILLLVISILMKNKELGREEGITRLLEFTVT